MYNNLFIDSGAFSASRKGEPINIDDYITFLQQNKESFTLYCVLDVIGDYKATWENQKIMEENGLNPLPVHHLEDPMKCLDWCLEYDYFALGGMATAPMNKSIVLFDKCWDIICDKDCYPKSKVHGFGMASPQLVYSYPWFSVDSSSWVSYGRYGIVILPKKVRGSFCYSVPPVKVFVSDKSTKKGEDGIHYTSLSPYEKESFDEYLTLYDLPFGNEETKGVSNDNFWRDFANYLFFAEMCKKAPVYPYPWKRKKEITFNFK